MYMKLEFSTKLNIIREKRRLRVEHDRTKKENNVLKQEEPVSKKEIPIKYSMEDKKILLQKLHFINNINAQQSQKISPPTSINKNKITQNNISQLNITTQIKQINHDNCENISIIINEIVPCANNKFYE